MTVARRRPPATRGVALAATLVAISLVGGVRGRAYAGEPDAPVSDARAAYERGARAYDRRDYETAARELAYADAIVPNTVALTTALRSVVQTSDAALGMTLVERAERRAAAGEADEDLAAAAASARSAFAYKAGRMVVRCGTHAVCRASVDGDPVTPGVATWLLPGAHRVTFTDGARTATRSVEVRVGAPGEATFPEDPPSAAPAPADGKRPTTHDGVSPAWFWAAGGVTLVVGGVALASSIDWKNRHSDFDDHPTEEKSADGQAAQTRTNVLWAVTAGGVVATAILGTVAVRWSRPTPGVASLSVGLQGPGLAAVLAR